MADESGVLVLGDSTGGELSSTSRELLTAGRKAADDLGEELAIGLLGDTLDQPSQQAISYGADKVYAVTHPQLAQYQVDLYLAAMEALCRRPQSSRRPRRRVGHRIAGRHVGPTVPTGHQLWGRQSLRGYPSPVGPIPSGPLPSRDGSPLPGCVPPRRIDRTNQ